MEKYKKKNKNSLRLRICLVSLLALIAFNRTVVRAEESSILDGAIVVYDE